MGGELGTRFGRRLEIVLGARVGDLSVSRGAGVDRDVAQLDAEIRYLTLPWLVVETGATARTYTAAIARQRWSMLRVGAEARIPFASGGIEGIGRGELLPVVSVTGLERPELAFTAAAGLEYRRRQITVGLFYGLERYDFPPQNLITRLEQLSSLTVRVSGRLPIRS